MLANNPTLSNDVADTTLVDSFGRVHDSVRISVIDQCNIRCTYCMPEVVEQFFPAQQLLTFDEILRIAEILSSLGVRKIRLTGGEPLLRHQLPDLVGRLNALGRIEDIALTTNGILLPRYAQQLKDNGLQRLNISLDTLHEETFQRISRRKGLHRVLDGIEHAVDVGFDEVRLNALAMRGLTEEEILPLVEFARARNLTMRFIEYMPLDADHSWSEKAVFSGAEIRQRIESVIGPMRPSSRVDPSQPAVDYEFEDGSGTVGFINPISQPFCGNCNRIRLTADGKLKNCLFSDQSWDLRSLLRDKASDAQILNQIQQSVQAKLAGHLISRPGFQQPQRAMYQIGG